MTPILIILQTYARTNYALETIRTAKTSLRFADGFKWFITDDGSPASHLRDVKTEIGSENIVDIFSRRASYGVCANQAQAFANRNGYDLTLWLEDDWRLRAPLDLASYAEILRSDAFVGMVRLGRIPPDLDTRTEYYAGAAFLWYQLTTPYAFSGNPSLRHRRFSEVFGDYPECQQPGETERIYDAHIRTIRNAPKIIHPIDFGTYGLFQHIGDIKSF